MIKLPFKIPTMVKFIGLFVIIAAAASAGWFFQANPGRAVFEFLGYEVEVPFILGMAMLFAVTFAFFLLVWGIYIAFTSPGKIRAFLSRRRREQGYDALERALIASAAGDGEAAVRQAARADSLLDRPALSTLLAARAAESAGNIEGAEAHYEALLEDNRTRVVARRGLAQLASERGDMDATLEHAKDAFARAKGARWAFDALFDAQIAQGRWDGALEALAEGERRKHIAPDTAKRRRAVILTASALGLEESEPERARDLADAACKAAPGFAPAATLASRLMAKSRRHKRAADVLEAAWTQSPHPAIARAYQGLRKTDSKAKRLERLKGLAALNPEHRESKLLLVQVALDDGDARTGRRILDPLLEEDTPSSARECALAARLARLEGEDEDARRWMTRAAHASNEADWSDIDPEGRAFPYTDDDWKRMVYVYGEEGRLIHPRHERFEGAAEAVPETALLEAPKPARNGSGITPGSGTAYVETARQPDDPGITETGEDDSGPSGQAA